MRQTSECIPMRWAERTLQQSGWGITMLYAFCLWFSLLGLIESLFCVASQIAFLPRALVNDLIALARNMDSDNQARPQIENKRALVRIPEILETSCHFQIRRQLLFCLRLEEQLLTHA